MCAPLCAPRSIFCSRLGARSPRRRTKLRGVGARDRSRGVVGTRPERGSGETSAQTHGGPDRATRYASEECARYTGSRPRAGAAPEPRDESAHTQPQLDLENSVRWLLRSRPRRFARGSRGMMMRSFGFRRLSLDARSTHDVSASGQSGSGPRRARAGREETPIEGNTHFAILKRKLNSS